MFDRNAPHLELKMSSLRDVRHQFLERYERYQTRDEGIYSDGFLTQLEDLAHKLTDVYASWRPKNLSAKTTVEIFAPTLLRVQDGQTWDREGHETVSPTKELFEWTNGILHLCLYADRVYVPDPLEILAHSFIHDHMAMTSLGIHEPLIGNRRLNIAAAQALTLLEPLIASGVVELYPPLNCYHQFVAEELFGVNRGYTKEELESAWPDLYVSEGLFFAKALGASYTALQPQEYRSLEKASIEVSNSLGLTDSRILACLPKMALPFFEALDARVLVSARQNEKSFEDFRKFLREMSLKMVGGLEDPSFDKQLTSIEHDFVGPAVEKLQKDITGVTSLKARLSDAPIDFATGALGTLVLKGDMKEALLAGGVGALVKGLVKLISSKDKMRPAASTVYMFHTGRTPSLSLNVSLSSFGEVMRISDPLGPWRRKRR